SPILFHCVTISLTPDVILKTKENDHKVRLKISGRYMGFRPCFNRNVYCDLTFKYIEIERYALINFVKELSRIIAI
ncbi:MAG: hypothetical protein NZ961_13080, partial [Candidatus Poribacteria bacterium]|nr:hypothetical protein [Candidatus Poribacteria bacterium]